MYRFSLLSNAEKYIILRKLVSFTKFYSKRNVNWARLTRLSLVIKLALFWFAWLGLVALIGLVSFGYY